MVAGAQLLTLFVDSSIFYAAADGDDLQHERAARILTSGEPLLTTDHVVVETWLLLQRRLGFQAAERWWLGVRSGGALVEHAGAADLAVAWTIGESYSDQRFSIIDRTSFAVMQRLGVTRVASLDDDFLIYRFGRNRDLTFDVVR